MATIYKDVPPRRLANLIYAFSELNEVWTIHVNESGELWLCLLARMRKEPTWKRKYFKMSITNSYMTIWRVNKNQWRQHNSQPKSSST